MQLRAAEEQIILRSRAVEMQWSSDKCQQSAKGKCNVQSYLAGLLLHVSGTLAMCEILMGLPSFNPALVAPSVV